MKPRLLLPILPILLALAVANIPSAHAADFGFSVSSGHHHWHGGGVEFYTGDPGYTTWYPNDYGTTYYYGPSYYSDGYYGYGYSYPSLQFRTDSADYGRWYGDRGYRYGRHGRR